MLSWGIQHSDSGSSTYEYTSNTASSRVRAVGSEIFFTSEVCTDSVNALIAEIMNVIGGRTETASRSIIDSDSAAATVPASKRVTLYIDSPGGIVKDCLKFVDFVTIMRNDKRLWLTTVVHGMAASAATIMACVGDERYIAPSALAMVHELFGGSVGTFTQITSGMKRLNAMHNAITGVYLKFNKRITREQLCDLLLKETWFTAEEYVDVGFADAIFCGRAATAASGTEVQSSQQSVTVKLSVEPPPPPPPPTAAEALEALEALRLLLIKTK